MSDSEQQHTEIAIVDERTLRDKITTGGIMHDRFIVLDYRRAGGAHVPLRRLLQGRGGEADHSHHGDHKRGHEGPDAWADQQDETESAADVKVIFRYHKS